MNYEQAASFWANKIKQEKAMDPITLSKWIDTFLSQHKIIALATGANEDLRVTPLEYTYYKEALWIFSEGGLKFRNLAKDNHVAGAIFENKPAFGELNSIQLQGTIQIIEPFSSTYKEIAKVRHIPLEALKKLQEPMYLLKFIPEKMTCLSSSFKKEGYGTYQIWHK